MGTQPPSRRQALDVLIGQLLMAATFLGVIAIIGGLGLWMLGIPALR